MFLKRTYFIVKWSFEYLIFSILFQILFLEKNNMLFHNKFQFKKFIFGNFKVLIGWVYEKFEELNGHLRERKRKTTGIQFIMY